MTHLLLRSVSEKGASILVRDSDGGQMSAVSKYTSCLLQHAGRRGHTRDAAS